jgi:hypothetical protein
MLVNLIQAISKWAVEALGEALRLELNKYNIDVSAFFAKQNFIFERCQFWNLVIIWVEHRF